MIVAFYVGFFITFSSLCHFVALLAFFFTSNKATKFRENAKKKFEADFKEGGQRDAAQVLSNGFFATFFSILYLIDCGYGERPIDFVYDYKATQYSLAVLGSLCAACGDTFSSELGVVLAGNSSNTVFHIIKWKRVPKGANGGVSFLGTCASALGGFLVGLAYYVSLKICLFYQNGSDDSHSIVEQWPILLIGTLCGLFGSLLDSVLGGYFQYSGINKKTRMISNTPSDENEHISGRDWLSNNQVNLLACFLTSILTPYISFKLYRHFDIHTLNR